MWLELGTYTLQNDWLYTPIVKAQTFRITHLSVPIRQQEYVKAVIGLDFYEDEIPSILNPQRLTSRQEREIFNFISFDDSPRRLIFKRLEKSQVIWRIKVEFKSMLVPSNKPRATTAQPQPDVTVSNVKVLVLKEKADASRGTYLLTNTGSQTLYFKYVPIGVDPTTDAVLVSPTNWDFVIEPGRQWFDQTLSQNGLVAISGSASQSNKIKAIEYNYL